MDILILIVCLINLGIHIYQIIPKRILQKATSKLPNSMQNKSQTYFSQMKSVAQINDEKRFNALTDIDKEIELSYREKYEH
jgi:hypothetical protein